MYPTQENVSISGVNWRDAGRLPNLVSIARMVLCIPIAVLGLQPGWQGLLGFWLFVLAAASDKLDGWLAKRNDGALMTKLGAMLDPMVDKFLTVVTLGVVIGRGEDSIRGHVVVVTAVIFFREVAVFYTRIGRKVESAGEPGRLSMLVTCVALGLVLLPVIELSVGAFHVQWGRTDTVLIALLYFALGNSINSGWGYWAAWCKAQHGNMPKTSPSIPESQG